MQTPRQALFGPRAVAVASASKGRHLGIALAMALVAVIALGFSGGFAQAESAATPVEIVRELYGLDRSGRGDEIFEGRSDVMARYFSPDFIAARSLAKSRDLGPPLLEGDPLTGQQEAGATRVQNLVPDGPSAVVATLVVPAASGAKSTPFTIRFDFVDVAGRPFVNDIEYPAALKSLNELADRQSAARLAAYVGSYRKILAHVLSVSGARP